MTAERILAATQELMVDRSFEEISVAEIVHRAHASASSFYARFPDKDALLGCLYERHSRSQRQFIDELLSTERWRDVPLASTLRATFPVIFEAYRADQGLIRAFLDLASSDERFKQTWAETGNYIIERVQDLIRTRSFEVTHPDPMTGVEYAVEFVFSNLACDILTHEINSPRMAIKMEQLILMMLRFMGIPDLDPVSKQN